MKVLITGGTNGMGKGVALALAARDEQRHEVIVLGRSMERGASTIRELQARTGNLKASFVRCDLTKLSDVSAAIAELHATHQSLDGVFINAGLGYAARREETPDGLEPHFQVNYLAQFMLTLNLLDLLERSAEGGRVVFNVTEGGHIFWEDLQRKKAWDFEGSIHQAMVAKRMFYTRLHRILREGGLSKLSVFGFEIPKTVWSNQVNIIPSSMRAMATVVKWFGGFISIEECGAIIAPLFTEGQDESLERSGKLVTAKKGVFIEKAEDLAVLEPATQDKLWRMSLELCADEGTRRIADALGAPWAGSAPPPAVSERGAAG